MSAPGFTNLNSSRGYSQNSTPNGGAAPPYRNGKAGREMRPASLSMLAPRDASVTDKRWLVVLFNLI